MTRTQRGGFVSTGKLEMFAGISGGRQVCVVEALTNLRKIASSSHTQTLGCVPGPARSQNVAPGLQVLQAPATHQKSQA